MGANEKVAATFHGAETTHNPCCSSHGENMTCDKYRRTHFVEVGACCGKWIEPELRPEQALRAHVADLLSDVDHFNGCPGDLNCNCLLGRIRWAITAEQVKPDETEAAIDTMARHIIGIRMWHDEFGSTAWEDVLGIARTPIEDGEGFEALIKLRDVKHILAIFKSRRGIATKITLTRTGGTPDGVLAVSLADGLFADADDLTAKYSLIDGQFPKVHELFTKWQPASEAPRIGYNAAYLAKFQHVQTRDMPIKVSPGDASKPTIVQAGDFFLGAIMPVRIVDMKFSEVADWTAMYAEPKPTAKRAPAKKAAAKKAVARPRTRVRKPAA